MNYWSSTMYNADDMPKKDTVGHRLFMAEKQNSSSQWVAIYTCLASHAGLGKITCLSWRLNDKVELFPRIYQQVYENIFFYNKKHWKLISCRHHHHHWRRCLFIATFTYPLPAFRCLHYLYNCYVITTKNRNWTIAELELLLAVKNALSL